VAVLHDEAIDLAAEFAAVLGINGRWRIELHQLDGLELSPAATLRAWRLETFDASDS